MSEPDLLFWVLNVEGDAYTTLITSGSLDASGGGCSRTFKASSFKILFSRDFSKAS
jgi:hypothetical protein